MSERPDSAGLWEREGKFYRVWLSTCERCFYVHDIHDGDHVGAIYTTDDSGWRCPTGNWRKLTAESATANRKPGFWVWDDAKGTYVEPSPAAPSPEVIDKYQDFSDQARFFVWAWDATDVIWFDVEKTTATDKNGNNWTLETVVNDDWVELRQISCGKRKFEAPPEVIDNLRAEVLAWREADLYCDLLDYLVDEDTNGTGFALREVIRAARGANGELAPPRPAFTAPEKPELVLVRLPGGKDSCWAVREGFGYRIIGVVETWFGANTVEVINPETGEPLATN